MSGKTPSASHVSWEPELALLGEIRRSRKLFLDQVCAASASQDEKVLAPLRLDSAYQLAEFLFLISANRIETTDDMQSLAEAHNQYLVDLLKDDEKIRRLGLTRERLLDAIFTADTLPRLLQNWTDAPGSIDQSNLARFLVAVMSTETCRKIVVASAEAGFLERRKSPYGAMIVRSKGTIEAIFGKNLRELRQSLL